jgi:hypothetical protein
MAKRLLPTGTCWCGCGTETDLGSFFAPGHDKRAESRLIMEVFGGVPQFLSAFGRGPEDASMPKDASWVDGAMRLVGLRNSERERLAVEHMDPGERSGPLKRTKHDAQLQPIDLTEGSAIFIFRKGNTAPNIWVPLVDVLAVYKDSQGWVVRVAGALKFTGSGIDYVAYGPPSAQA